MTAQLIESKTVNDVQAEKSGCGSATALDLFTCTCARLARVCMVLSVIGLVCLIAAVAFQVFGRHVLNNTPTWAESLSLLLVLFVTMMGAAVGVRDAGHIGLADLLSPPAKRRLCLLVHALVLLFGAMMAWYCGELAVSVHAVKIPNLGLSEAWKYVPALLSGVLIVLFSLEHIIATYRNQKVVPAWL